MEFKGLLFIVTILSELVLLTGLFATWKVPNLQIWPPPSGRSWQFWFNWILFPIVYLGIGWLGRIDAGSMSLPFMIRTWIGLLLLSGGLILAVWGVIALGVLRSTGLPGTFRVVGPYRYCRNPQYVGIVAAFLGYGLWTSSWMTLLTGILHALWYIVAPYLEERTLLERFGEPYRRYLETVPRFFPFQRLRERPHSFDFLVFIVFPLLLVGVSPAQTLNPTELQQWLKDRDQGTRHFLLVDVRTPAEYQSGFIPGTDTLLPLQEFQAGNVEVPINPEMDTVVVYCRTGHRAGIVQNLLKTQGFRFVFNGLGIVQWTNAGYTLTTEKTPSEPWIFYTLRGASAVGMLAKTRTPTTWQAGKNMTYVSVTPDGRTVLATSSAEDKVYVFSALDGTLLREISVGKSPKGVKVSPDGRWALVAEEGNGTLGVLELKTWKRVLEIPIGTQPHNIVFTQDGTRAYVTVQGDNKIAEVDLKTRKVKQLLRVGGSPHNLDLTPDGKFLLTANRQSNDVAVIDVSKWKVIQRIPVSPGHHGIDITPDGRYALVTGIGADTLNLIDLQSFKRIKAVVVGKGPHGVRATPQGNYAFVAVTFKNEIVEVEIPSLRIIRRYPTDEVPFWIAIPGNF